MKVLNKEEKGFIFNVARAHHITAEAKERWAKEDRRGEGDALTKAVSAKLEEGNYHKGRSPSGVFLMKRMRSSLTRNTYSPFPDQSIRLPQQTAGW